MKRINWKKLRQSIPTHVKIGKRLYEIVWVENFKDGATFGETRWEPPQIAIKTGESDKDTVHTYLHEVAHAVSHEGDIGLTETQVIKVEEALTYLLKPNNVFVEKE